MGEPARSEVVDMVDYLRETIVEMDAWIHEQQAKRNQFAVRLAALEASSDPDVAAAVAEYEARSLEDGPPETAESAEGLIAEAHRRFVVP